MHCVYKMYNKCLIGNSDNSCVISPVRLCVSVNVSTHIHIQKKISPNTTKDIIFSSNHVRKLSYKTQDSPSSINDTTVNTITNLELIIITITYTYIYDNWLRYFLITTSNYLFLLCSRMIKFSLQCN